MSGFITRHKGNKVEISSWPESEDPLLQQRIASATEHDWPGDFHLENGSYQNKCLKCEVIFIGYKRRLSCRVCDTERKLSNPS